MSKIAERSDILAASLSVLHYYGDGLTKLLPDLERSSQIFLDISVKPFSPCTYKFYTKFITLW